MPGKFSFIAAAAIGLTIALGGVATAGKKNRSQVVKDPTDRGGKFYDAKTYAACDIKKIKATVKRNNLVAKVTTRGKQEFPNSYLNLNTKGSKRSDPEYQAQPSGGLVKLKGDRFDFDEKGAKAKQKNKGKAVQFSVPLKKIGKPKKTGFQARTCGEGAVDIAPGGNYFDDTSFDGTIANKFKNIKTSG